MATGKGLMGRRGIAAIVTGLLLGSLTAVGGVPSTLGADPPKPKPGRLLSEGGTTTALTATAVVSAGFTDSAVLGGLTAPIAVQVVKEG